MAEPTKFVDVPQALEKVAHGERLKKAEADAVIVAASRLRHEFLKEANDIVGRLTPASGEMEAFKNCMNSIGTLLVQAQIVSGDEMGSLFFRIEKRERGEPV